MKMNLPNVISDLLEAQANFNSEAYANCFSEKALVFDEGHNHKGRNEIKIWIEKANENYRTRVEPINFSTSNNSNILTVNVSGTFRGSPIVMQYHLEINNGLIQSLKITS